MANKKYKVLEPLMHSGVHYTPTSEVELTEAEAEALKAQGVIEGGATIQTVTTEADGGAYISPDEGTELAQTAPTADTREEELKALFKAKGWREIAKIAEPLGIEKPEEGWDAAIPQIVAKEKEIEQA